MTKKKRPVYDLTSLKKGDTVWAYFQHPSPGAWHECTVVDGNRGFWTVRGPHETLKLPKRIYEGDNRGHAPLVFLGLVTFSEEQRDTREWVRVNRARVARAVEAADYLTVLRVAHLVGIKNPMFGPNGVPKSR